MEKETGKLLFILFIHRSADLVHKGQCFFNLFALNQLIEIDV